MRLKRPSIMQWVSFLSRRRPTDSAEEAFLISGASASDRPLNLSRHQQVTGMENMVNSLNQW